jgi:hypothetical protein
MAARLARVEREIGELADLAEARPDASPVAADAGADENARGVAEGQVFERERSTRQEVL